MKLNDAHLATMKEDILFTEERLEMLQDFLEADLKHTLAQVNILTTQLKHIILFYKKSLGLIPDDGLEPLLSNPDYTLKEGDVARRFLKSNSVKIED